jgi:hypothetical protein
MIPLQYQLVPVPMLGKGMILLDRLDVNGGLTGALPIGNATKFGIDAKDDIAEQYSSMNAASSLIATALKKRQVKISITGTDFRSEVLAIAMMAAGKTSLAVAATTYTAEALASATVKKSGRYFQTLHRNIDPVTPPVVKGGAAFATTYVLDTDYHIADPVQGLIYIIPGGAGDADTANPLSVDYHTLVGAFDQVAGATVAKITAKLIFSPDPTDGARIGLDVWKVNFSPTGTSEFIADDYGNWQLEGLALDDSVHHPAAPFYQLTYY